MAIGERISAQDEVYDFLLTQPTAHEIVRFKPSVETQEHLRDLLAANRNGTLTAQQQAALSWIAGALSRSSAKTRTMIP